MYTQEIGLGLNEEFSIIEDILCINESDNRATVLVPDNKAEIYIPVKGKCNLKQLGSVRSINLEGSIGCFVMPRRKGIEMTLNHGSKCLILKLNPIYAKKMADGLNEISNGTYDFSLSSDFAKSIIEAYENEDMFIASGLVQDKFFDGIDFNEHNRTILESIDQIKNTFGTISVKEIYSNLNVSKSKLEQHFNKEIGLTPKEFCKIEKINCFINSYLNGQDQTLTELTYRCGYYDQSHLIKDFKYFLDTSPKKFFTGLIGEG